MVLYCEFISTKKVLYIMWLVMRAQSGKRCKNWFARETFCVICGIRANGIFLVSSSWYWDPSDLYKIRQPSLFPVQFTRTPLANRSEKHIQRCSSKYIEFVDHIFWKFLTIWQFWQYGSCGSKEIHPISQHVWETHPKVLFKVHSVNNQCYFKVHSVNNQMLFLGKLWPERSICQIIISSSL